ncbi:MAG: hypothetical protein V2B19_13590 [Pseudomonadota bacterium]
MPKPTKACSKPGSLYIELRCQNRKNPKKWEKLSHLCGVKVTGGGIDQTKSMRNSETFNSLPAGAYTIALTPVEEEATFEIEEEVEQKGKPTETWRPVGTGPISSSATIEDGKTSLHYFRFFPYELLVKVVGKGVGGKKDELLQGDTVKVKTGAFLAGKSAVTNTEGVTDFGIVPGGTKYTLELILTDEHKRKYVIENEYKDAPGKRFGNDPFLIRLEFRRVYLQLLYKDPDGTVRPFPKDFPVTAVCSDPGSVTEQLKVIDNKGNLNFQLHPDKKKFTLMAGDDKSWYFVFKRADSNAPWVPDTPPLKEVPNDSDAELRSMVLNRKRFFRLPKAWSLAVCEWRSEEGLAVGRNGLSDLPAVGVCTKERPGKLTLLPKVQYVRFEFHDRKYCISDHNKKRVGIPPIVLKGARGSTSAGQPVAGTYDAISNWMVDESDAANACQSLPWIITRKGDGADLPKLNNKLLLEFGMENGYVHSTRADYRKIDVLDPGSPKAAKRKPGKDRNQYYDLPKHWKSRCYFTRFSDPAKNKFFDELRDADDPDLEASFAKATKLVFSLDDIVLVDNAGSQAIKDKDENDPPADKALSKYSRITLLELDPGDKYKVKVYKPRATAAYWSESEFRKEAATEIRRNVIVDYPVNPRVVVFCNNFHDIFDKRTEAADFTKKEILGARAAKLEDTDVSSGKVVFSSDADVTNFYVHLKRLFHLRYLHYGATDGTTVFGALVTYWQARFKIAASHGGSNADITAYREKGMERAMKRWNEKDYYFEENDDATHFVVKHFCLFEAKDIETSPGTFEKRGGKQICMVSVTTDAVGSSAAVNGTTMQMRKSGALDEGNVRGQSPAASPLPVILEYDVADAAPKSAFSHELGHAAIGAYDDYVTGILEKSLWKYTNNHASMDMEGQRYYGMPYELDEAAIMNVNRAVRMRYFWGRANWLNDQAKTGANLNKFLEAKKFRIAYEPAGKAKLKYVKPDAHKSIYTPLTEQNVSLDKKGKCDLHLYHLGNDEFAQILQGGPYNGILALVIKLSARFVRILPWATAAPYAEGDLVAQGGTNYACVTAHTSGTFATDLTAVRWVPESAAWAANTAYTVNRWAVEGGKFYRCNTAHTSAASFAADQARWTEKCKIPTADLTEDQQFDHLEALRAAIDAMLAKKFKLTGSGNFSKTHLRISTQWEKVASGAAATGGTHFTIEFGLKSKVFQPNAQTIKAGADCNLKTIIRYLFGKIGDNPAQWTAEGGLIADLTKTDLAKLKTWMDTKAGGVFTVADI